MRGLSRKEYALLVEIRDTDDFYDWETFDVLEERGLLSWWYGPLSKELDARDPADPDNGEECDPLVTPLGHLAILAYRATS